MKKITFMVLVIAFFMGIIVGVFNRIDLAIGFVTFSFSNLLIQIIILIILMLFAFIFPSYFLYLIYELFSFGYVFINMVILYKFKGLLFIIGFLFIIKLLSWFLLLLNSFYTLKMNKYTYRFIFNKMGRNLYNMKIYLKKTLVINAIFVFLLIFNIFLTYKIIIPWVNYLLF